MIEELKKKVESSVDACCDYIVEVAARIDEDVSKVLSADLDELPLLVNIKTPAAQKLLVVRLANEKVQDFEPYIDIAFNYNFNSEDYRNIGVNDGTLMSMADIADTLGMVDVARRARSAVYSYV